MEPGSLLVVVVTAVLVFVVAYALGRLSARVQMHKREKEIRADTRLTKLSFSRNCLTARK